MFLFLKDDYRFPKGKLSKGFWNFLSFVHGKAYLLWSRIITPKNQLSLFLWNISNVTNKPIIILQLWVSNSEYFFGSIWLLLIRTSTLQEEPYFGTSRKFLAIT